MPVLMASPARIWAGRSEHLASRGHTTSRTWNIGLHMLTTVAKQRREGWLEAMPRVAERAPQVQERTGTTSAAHGLGLDRLASLCSTPMSSDSLGPAPSPVR